MKKPRRRKTRNPVAKAVKRLRPKVKPAKKRPPPAPEEWNEGDKNRRRE